jgi:hypothetical protein
MRSIALLLTATALLAQAPAPKAAAPKDKASAPKDKAAKPQTLTAEEVIARNQEAEGGVARRKAVQTLRMTGKMVGGEKEVEVIAENKRPDFMRVDVIVQKAVQTSAFDGKGGWRIDPFAGIGGGQSVHILTPLESAEAKLQADMDGPLVDHAAKGHKIAYGGLETLPTGPAHRLKVTLRSGAVSNYYFDATTFLKVRQTALHGSAGQETETEMLFSDYRPVGGLQFAHVVEQGMVGAGQRQKFILEKVEVDVPIETSRFMTPMVFRADAPKPVNPGTEEPKR